MRVSTIVGVGKNNVIGRANTIPWHLPADLKYFKRVTTGHPIIMGRRCYESIGRPLPDRTNIIVSRNPDFQAPEECILVHSLGAGLVVAQERGAEEAFIIGGGEIYQRGLPLSTRLYITYIDVEVPDGDVFFPEIDTNSWALVSEESHQKDAKNPHDYTFVVLERL